MSRAGLQIVDRLYVCLSICHRKVTLLVPNELHEVNIFFFLEHRNVVFIYRSEKNKDFC